MKTIHLCAALHCDNNFTNCDLSFFRFPKDVSRARTWATACQRDDLVDKAENLHFTTHRLCAMHFDKSMFTNAKYNRIHKDAIPSIFSLGEGSSSKRVDEVIASVPVIDASTLELQTPDKLETLLPSQIKVEPGTFVKTEELQTPDTKLDALLPSQYIKVEELSQISKAHRQTQTHCYLLQYTPKIIKMKSAFMKMRKQNYQLIQKLNMMEAQINSKSSSENRSHNKRSRSKSGKKLTPAKDVCDEFMSILSHDEWADEEEGSSKNDQNDKKELTMSDSCPQKRYCRLCFNPSDSNRIMPLDASCSTNTLESDELKKIINACIPFFDLLVTDAVLCDTCLNYLRKFYKFKARCLKNQKVIKHYMKSNQSGQQLYSLSQIVEEEIKKRSTIKPQTECKAPESHLLKPPNNSQASQTFQVQNTTDNNKVSPTKKSIILQNGYRVDPKKKPNVHQATLRRNKKSIKMYIKFNRSIA